MRLRGANYMRPLSWGAQTEKILTGSLPLVPPSPSPQYAILPPPPPPILNHYVKVWHVRLGVADIMCLLLQQGIVFIHGQRCATIVP